MVLTAGGSGALLLTIALLINPGEGLMLADPAYPCNRHFLKAFDAEGQLVPVGPGEAYQLSGRLVEASWRANTRGVLLASPSNPTGSIVREDEMRAISQVVKARSGVLVVDEIYHGLSYQPEKTASILSIDNDAFVVNSFSKYFGMTGWRLGWMVVPDDATSEVEKLAQKISWKPSARNSGNAGIFSCRRCANSASASRACRKVPSTYTRGFPRGWVRPSRSASDCWNAIMSP